MSILALGRKQKEKSFQSKERNKAKRANSESKIERGKKKKKGNKIPDQGSEENKRNMQEGLWIRHLNKYRVVTK